MTAGTQEITLIRSVQAPLSQVYAAFTSAEGWCAWCCETAEADARVGGRLHIYTEGYNAYGEFTALEPDRAVAFTWDGDKEPPMHVDVRLEEQKNDTSLTFNVAVLGNLEDWPAFATFLERTWGRALDNLKEVLEAR